MLDWGYWGWCARFGGFRVYRPRLEVSGLFSVCGFVFGA